MFIRRKWGGRCTEHILYTYFFNALNGWLVTKSYKMIDHYPQNQLALFSVISSLYLDIYTHDLNFMCLHCLSFRWITGRSATRVVKGSSSQCHVAAAPSLCSCHAAAQSLCTPSTQESWSRCSGATTTTSTAASFTRTTRWDALKSQGGDCFPSSGQDTHPSAELPLFVFPSI